MVKIPTTHVPAEERSEHGQPPRVTWAVEQLAQLMDAAFEIPGVRWRVGLDALLGLFPVFGDVFASAVSLYILGVAARNGVPRSTLARMSLNILIDHVVGSVPVIGDVFDVWWKSNLQNAELLRRTIEVTPAERRRQRWTDWLFIAAFALIVIGLLIASIYGLYLLVTFLGSFVLPAA